MPRFVSAFAAILVFLIACAPPHLAPPPNLLLNRGSYPDAELPAYLRTAQPTIFYVTDRVRKSPPGAPVDYGHERSRAMAFGTKTMSFGEGLTWEELKTRSLGQISGRTPLEAVSVEELVRFPPTPVPFRIDGATPLENPAERAEYDTASRAFQARMTAELARANRSEVIIYVHGVANDFEDGADTMANIWHYSGRIGVPLVYTWPADNPGLFGYFTDRESSEFSVFHLKETLRLLAAIPTLDKIHVIAHSRGTDLAATALRELLIAEMAAGRDPRRTLKVENLILAAADLDLEVVGQRLIAEHFAAAFKQITIYLNGRDTALGFAESIMRGLRLGRLQLSDLDASEVRALEDVQRVHLINVEDVIGGGSHSYFRQNPDVMSDIVLILRTSAAPGTDTRPLEQVAPNFFNMHRGYPFGRPAAIFDSDAARP